MQDGLLNTILGFGFTVITTMLGWCIAEVRRVKKDVLAVVEKERKESIVAARRIDVVDGTLSDITEERLNSRNIVEKGAAAPRVHSKLMQFIHGTKS